MLIDADDSGLPTYVRPNEAREPISPELVLVSPELRYVLPPALWSPRVESLEPLTPPEPTPSLPVTGAPSLHLVVRLVVYALWQTLMGLLFGLAAVAALVCLVAVTTFLR
jgi:hypothetical protein